MTVTRFTMAAVSLTMAAAAQLALAVDTADTPPVVPPILPAAEAGIPATAPGEAAPEAADETREPDRSALEGGTIARVVRHAFPTYPSAALSRRQEGWVQLSFRVQSDGAVADPIVEDSSGIPEFERAALRSILRTRYRPATWNGQPIEQCAAKVLYVFKMGNQTGARRSFIRDYKEAVGLEQGDRAAEAEAKLDEMMAKGAWTNYESSRLWLLRAAFQSKRGDEVGQLRSLRRAALRDGEFLEPEIYRQTLLITFSLEVGQKQYGPALATYEKLRAIKPFVAEPAMENVAYQIRRAIESDGLLSFPGVVEYRSGCEQGRPNWQHELLRRKFTFTEVGAGVDSFELRCDWKRIVDRVSTEKTWEVPASWGWCQVFVFGEVGAKATLIEYPLAADQKTLVFKPLLTR
jgi:TonB family protein